MQNNKVIIGIVALLVIVGLGFSIFYFSGGSADVARDGELALATTSEDETAAEALDRDYRILLGKFQNLRLSTSTLSDRVFLSLEDKGVKLSEQPFGRDNPFAPLGSEDRVVEPEQEPPLQ